MERSLLSVSPSVCSLEWFTSQKN